MLAWQYDRNAWATALGMSRTAAGLGRLLDLAGHLDRLLRPTREERQGHAEQHRAENSRGCHAGTLESRSNESHIAISCAAIVAPRFQHASTSAFVGLPETTVRLAVGEVGAVYETLAGAAGAQFTIVAPTGGLGQHGARAAVDTATLLPISPLARRVSGH